MPRVASSAAASGSSPGRSPSSLLAIPQHDEQHSGRLVCVERVRNVGRHTNDGARRRADWWPTTRNALWAKQDAAIGPVPASKAQAGVSANRLQTIPQNPNRCDLASAAGGAALELAPGLNRGDNARRWRVVPNREWMRSGRLTANWRQPPIAS